MTRVDRRAYLETSRVLGALSLPGAKVRVSVRFYPQQGARGEAATVSVFAGGSPPVSLRVVARALRAPGLVWKIEHFL
ncbi:MAG: hypothetical protein ACYCSF_05375 [Acidimicrobiales bacterium]